CGFGDLLVHDLRDTAASLAISSDASIKAVQRMLGHAAAAMTLDIYGGLYDDDLEDLADRLEERHAAQARHKLTEQLRVVEERKEPGQKRFLEVGPVGLEPTTNGLKGGSEDSSD